MTKWKSNRKACSFFRAARWAIWLCAQLFCGGTFAQPLSGDAFDARVNEILAETYYQDLPVTLRSLAGLRRRTQAADQPELTLTLWLYGAWCADYHDQVDTLQHYLQQAEALATRRAAALDTLDADGGLRRDLAYTRGVFYYAAGDYPGAIKAFKSISVPGDRPDSVFLARAHAYLGNAYYRLENYARAITYLRRAEAWLPQAASSYGAPGERSYLKALYRLYQAQSQRGLAQLGDTVTHLTALRLCQDAVARFERIDDPAWQNGLLVAYQQLGKAYQEADLPDSALATLRRAVAFAGPETLGQATSYKLYGTVLGETGRYADAHEALERSLRIMNEVLPLRHQRRAAVLIARARVWVRQQQWANALRDCQRALVQLVPGFTSPDDFYENPTIEPAGAYRELLEALQLKAETLEAWYYVHRADTNSLMAALDTYHLMVRELDALRRTFPSAEYRRYLSSQFFVIHERAIRVALTARTDGWRQRDFLSEAFFFAEKSKSLLLLESVREVSARATAGVPARWVAREQALTRRVAALTAKRDRATSDSVRQIFQQRLTDDRIAYERLIDTLADQFPEYYRLKYDPTVVSLGALQATLSAGTKVIVYFYGDSTLYAFGVSVGGVTVSSTPLHQGFTEELAALVGWNQENDFIRAGRADFRQRYAGVAHRLYRQLVAPHLTEADRRLVIVADGQLHYLPFDALLTAPPAPADTWSDYAYLIRRLPVRYEYSTTLLAEPIHQPEAPPALAYAGFAPAYRTGDSSATRQFSVGAKFSELLFNQEEVRYAANLFKGKMYRAGAASKEAFREVAPRSKLLHLSMHAYTNDASPLYSGLVFSPLADQAPYLYAYELYNMRLRSELTILSACETGVGKLTRGEGMMSLGRAFKYAGCPAITMSLWKVSDRSTRDLMQQFCQALRAGANKDEALRDAKLAYLANADGATAYPYYWASFVMIGPADPLSSSVPTERRVPWLLLLGGLSVLVGAGYWYRQKKGGTPPGAPPPAL